MAYKNLRQFIKELDKKGWLHTVHTQVDPELEIAAITDRASKNNGPALFFANVLGSKYPVLTNAFGSLERIKLALGVDDLDEIGRRIEKLVQIPHPNNLLDKVKSFPLLLEISSFFPKTVTKAPVQEVVEENPSLDTLPILKCWPNDGGKFITLPLVFTKDPVTGQQNAGMYRMHVYDATTTGMHWHLHKDGASHFERWREAVNGHMEAAVVLGGDPAVIYAATAPLPRNMDEMLFAGFLRQAPVEMVQCKTIDLKVPAEAEFVLEGYVDLAERRREGPFGDHTGYYSPAEAYPVFHLKCITRRKDPLYPATVVGIPPMEDCYLGKATERIFLPLLKLQFPEIMDMHLPFAGVFHNCAIVSIKKEYPGQAKKIINALWGMGQMMFTKTIIVVDADVDVQDLARTAWRIFNSIDPKRDFVFTEGPLDALDHAAPLPNYGSKVGIDATKKWASEGYARQWPEEVKATEEIISLVNRRWEEYGFKSS